MPHTTPPELDINEPQRSRQKTSFDEREWTGILRHALVEKSDEAWSALRQCFGETVRLWIRCHPSSDVALLCDSEENYIAQTFSRFCYAVHHQHIEFTTVPAALRYLRATLNSLIIDTLRSHMHSRTQAVSLAEPEFSGELTAEDLFERESLWENMQSLLSDERERRIFYLLYYCGLKPKEVVNRCPQEFNEVKEIYRLNALIIERLQRNTMFCAWSPVTRSNRKCY